MSFMMSAAGALLLPACLTSPPVQHELVGKPLRVEFTTGEAATVLLKSDSTTTFNDGERRFEGRSSADGRRICVDYRKMMLSGNECFTYPAAITRGVKTPFKHDDGETVWVTMM
jgi:hypothetical protein